MHTPACLVVLLFAMGGSTDGTVWGSTTLFAEKVYKGRAGVHLPQKRASHRRRVSGPGSLTSQPSESVGPRSAACSSSSRHNMQATFVIE